MAVERQITQERTNAFIDGGFTKRCARTRKIFVVASRFQFPPPRPGLALKEIDATGGK